MACGALIAAGCTKQTNTPSQVASAPAQPMEGAPRLVNSADGVHIEYHVYGKDYPEEPAVVLVHGWSCDSNYWRAQLADLKKNHTVVTLDLAGHGASGRNRRDWSIANYGEDVAAVVRQVPNRHVILVGHAMGGPVVLEATRRIGDRVIGIIGVEAFKSIGVPPPAPEQVEQLVQPFRADFIGHTRAFVSDYFFPKNADPRFVRKIADDMALEPPEVAVPSIVSLFKMDFPAVLETIHVPIIAINSDIGEATDEKRIQKTAPTFRATVLPGTSHFLMMDDPQRFNTVLLREIAALQAPPAGNG